MFEEEAEERARKFAETQVLDDYNGGQELKCTDYNRGEVAGYEKGFVDGANFSYSSEAEVIEKLKAENENLKAKLIAVNLLIPDLEKHSEVKKQRLAGAKEVIKLLLWDLQNKDANPAGDIAIAKLFLKGNDE